MDHGYLPFVLIPSHDVRALLGPDLRKAASLALKAILRHKKSLEVAHQQITYRKHCLAFSSRIGTQGDIILELGLGDPRLGHRLILENELREAQRRLRR